MKKVIVSIKMDNRNKLLDLEIMTESSVAKMLTAICAAYHIGNGKNYSVFANPLGRFLDPNETLEDAGVWDGAILTLREIK